MRFATRTLNLCLLGVLLAFPIGTLTASAQQQRAEVLFVCQHGNVKSLIAAALFNQAVQNRGLSIRASARGIRPEPAVPADIVRELEKDGLDVSQFTPQALTQSDISRAQRVIAIGVDLTKFQTAAPEVIEDWTDIPAASIDYAASRAALLRHIDSLLAHLQASQAQ